MGLTEDEVRQVQVNGVKAAFLSDQERTALWHSKQPRQSNTVERLGVE
jgi:adenosine deaminase